MATHRSSLIAGVWSSLMGKISLLLLTALFILAIIAPSIFGHGALTLDTANIYAPHSPEHLLGTDAIGRDIFSRVMYATRLSLSLALASTAFGIIVGLAVGSLRWLAPRSIGSASVAAVNIAIAFPSLLLALFAAVIFGTGVTGSVLAIGVAMVPWYARITQNLLSSVSEREYILASRTLGQSRIKILVRHLLPNVAEPLIVNAMLGAGGALLAFAGLSFLGIGIQPPEFDWGLLLKEGVPGIFVEPLAALAPAFMIVIAGLGFNLLGEAFARSIEVGVVSAKPVKPAQNAQASSSPQQTPGLANSTKVLEVENLNTYVPGKGGSYVHIVKDVSFTLGQGEVLGIVGESGSGKTLMVQSIADLNDDHVAVVADRVTLNGRDILDKKKGDTDRNAYLAKNLGYIFQDPSSSFNPTIRVGRQLTESLHQHSNVSWEAGQKIAVGRLAEVGVAKPELRVTQYPHEFSGGMLQRAMIAMGMIAGPKLLIADEPTTALDASVKHKILQLLARIRNKEEASIVIISHDITAILSLADRVLVMYCGRVVEEASVQRIMNGALHPYTKALLDVVPNMETPVDQPLATIPGRVVDFERASVGCPFVDRCPFAMAKCSEEMPPMVEYEKDQSAACWLYEEKPQVEPSSPNKMAGAE